MKRISILVLTLTSSLVFLSCGNRTKQQQSISANEDVVVLFDGTSLDGWRGYNKTSLPEAWTIEDGCLKINSSGRGEAGAENGGDIIFEQKFKDFEFTFEWKVAKGANSGVFVLAQEIPSQPIYISAPEYQILDNENHPDAKMGKNGNRQSASLYDMIPANPQNSKPYGEWNSSKISVYQGTVTHYQNDVKVLEYQLWTDQWKEMLDNSKFNEKVWPLAYELLLNCGGDNHEGYIGLQDHGDAVWYRNMKVKKL